MHWIEGDGREFDTNDDEDGDNDGDAADNHDDDDGGVADDHDDDGVDGADANPNESAIGISDPSGTHFNEGEAVINVSIDFTIHPKKDEISIDFTIHLKNVSHLN